ncbi:tRNA pseudouridine(38-40) synthase TruA [Pedobacter sp. MC2016-14]|uniref:tRNA pseudouridine(38-40) synthase TruA n=1 Tax=Pedobacter sp. MC2016-14 TaxID=2897327 RepID=UPI001E4C34A3|nr:tRNA pseudouridine(38-40) synthase TruA [Pedobacter sp. MC2016-14]MCD0488051.1 tRNA pseudouridine(38-40) synthase TruA [Pedobacter sp. MC2016-14]
MNTQRFFIEISYNGSNYHGWQIQPNSLTVQECLDKALSVYFRQPVVSLGCGRTDAGVHARQFFAHFDLHFSADSDAVVNEGFLGKSLAGINSLLPYDIAAKRIFKVHQDAHARFDATARAYQYHLHFHKDPFELNRSWLFKGELDVAAMNEAAQLLLKYTDFSCFSKSNTQTFTNNCKITEARFENSPQGLVFTIRADRFLRNMVRAIVGTLVMVGKKEITLNQLNEIIESKNRSNAGQSVPACGLYLVTVAYPFVN